MKQKLRNRLLPLVVATAAPPVAWAQAHCEPQRLTSPPASMPIRFGQHVATNGDQWFITDMNARTLHGPSHAGAVHVYDEVDGRLVHRQTITPADAQQWELFGSSISLDGNRILVGSIGTRVPGIGQPAGAGFMYEFDGEEWVEVARLWPVGVDERFGTGVVLSGETAVVWSNSWQSLHVYREADGDWAFHEFLEPDGPLSLNCFGQSMAAGDGWFFVAAPCETSTPRLEEGAIYVYRQEPDGSLRRTQKIGPGELIRLGRSMSFDGTTLAVGAPFYSEFYEGQGAVLLYEYDGERWVEVERITHSRASRYDQLGVSVTIDGDTLIAGVSMEDTPAIDGPAYLFRRSVSGEWHEIERLVPSAPASAGRYAETVATDGRFALVGAHGDEGPSGASDGAAYFFDTACFYCEADLDADGTLTIFDFLTFFNLFEDGEALADFDGDGELTLYDFLAYQTAFDAGCG